MVETHTSYMQRCLTLAEKGSFHVRPNPKVGCVIVGHGQVVAEGWHQFAGKAHAEINALAQAGDSARGATLYVTLEPCVHHGKTGPCCEAIIEAGIAKVVYGMIDPNPRNAGRGIARLQSAGIEVEGPVLHEECARLNPGFIKRMTRQLPYVRCKMAMSLDGRTAMASGESKWITGEAARRDVHQWRAESAAVITGVESILADDSALNARLEGEEYIQPLRVLVDSALRTPAQARVLQEPGPVLLATAGKTEFMPASQAPGRVEVKSFAAADGRVNLLDLLHYLAMEKECNEVLLEAGATLSGAMLQAGLVDEIIVYMAPKLLGHEGLPMFRLPNMKSLQDQIPLLFLDVRMMDKDCRMRCLVMNERL